jgi:hypothetical protein
MFVTLLTASCNQKKVNPKDPVGGREIISLDDGKVYILKLNNRQVPQIELSISKDQFGIAQLSSDGTGVPPITVLSREGVIEVSRSWIEDGNEITVTDTDGDGLADYRLIIPRDKSTGEKPRIEDIVHQFSKREHKGKSNGESGPGE